MMIMAVLWKFCKLQVVGEKINGFGKALPAARRAVTKLYTMDIKRHTIRRANCNNIANQLWIEPLAFGSGNSWG